MLGILYESEEWSSHKLLAEIQSFGVEARLINLEEDNAVASINGCDLLVSRVFASAQFRQHQRSLERMPKVIRQAAHKGIPMINPPQAHFYETSKALSTAFLKWKGIAVPDVYGVFFPEEADPASFSYPCVVKPDCGGRTTCTYIVHDAGELTEAMAQTPAIRMIAEEYIPPVHGYITRVEVIGGECRLILKRSVTADGLSAYHLGSVYTHYTDCPEKVRQTAVRVLSLLDIEFGSLDIIETEKNFYIIDVNAVSNASEDNTVMFGFDLMRETAAYIVKRYREMEKRNDDNKRNL
ncbi:ATP-grasp domain-containing protein [Eubacterium sp. 1001713B170207_170306_E7]|uniref:ATP-grasp domain-containing protein n=1 Tax=Eubacterium sp. 1001713B170207_170306_E7 TaxID=2787097 RepID=UPI00189A7CD5|nr:ATP-grasp domain-containing protein [Eubacterium sp. 1001713B170207_170306_E7]